MMTDFKTGEQNKEQNKEQKTEKNLSDQKNVFENTLFQQTLAKEDPVMQDGEYKTKKEKIMGTDLDAEEKDKEIKELENERRAELKKEFEKTGSQQKLKILRLVEFSQSDNI